MLVYRMDIICSRSISFCGFDAYRKLRKVKYRKRTYLFIGVRSCLLNSVILFFRTLLAAFFPVISFCFSFSFFFFFFFHVFFVLCFFLFVCNYFLKNFIIDDVYKTCLYLQSAHTIIMIHKLSSHTCFKSGISIDLLR
jgi:hypothetical protein